MSKANANGTNLEKQILVNPFQQEGRWYKANFHTHTTTSDGDTPPAERVGQYREKGYSVLAITDHEKTNDISRFSSEDFLVISGMETHPACKTGGDPYHLVCLNVPLDLQFPEGTDGNTRIRLVREAGGEVIYAHPYWCGHNTEEMRAVTGYAAMEVYNATCTRIGKGFSSVHWDNLLDSDGPIPAVASDDVHGGRDIFMGWTMLKARHLDVKSVMAALRTGSFYASCGPVIEDCRIENKELILKCSPVKEIHLMCRRSNGQSFYTGENEYLTQLKFPVKEYWKYVRVELVDREGNRAWTNPFVF